MSLKTYWQKLGENTAVPGDAWRHLPKLQKSEKKQSEKTRVPTLGAHLGGAPWGRTLGAHLGGRTFWGRTLGAHPRCTHSPCGAQGALTPLVALAPFPQTDFENEKTKIHGALSTDRLRERKKRKFRGWGPACRFINSTTQPNPGPP